MTGISQSSFENSFINSIYLAKIPVQGSTPVIRVFAKCFSSSDKRCYRTISSIWRTRFHVRVRGVCPQPGLISWHLGLFWDLYSRVTQDTCDKRIRVGVSKATENLCDRKADATNCICMDLPTINITVYENKSLSRHTNNFMLCNRPPGLCYQGFYIYSRAHSAKQLPSNCVSPTRNSAFWLLKS